MSVKSIDKKADMLSNITMFDSISGNLNIYKKTEQDEQLLISKIGKGRMLGEMNIIDRFPRSATVITQTRTSLLTLSHEHFEQILEEHSRAGISFFRGIARTLSLNLRNTSGKLADALM